MGSGSGNPNFDSFMLQTMMGRLQIRPPNLPSAHFPGPSLEELLLGSDGLSDDDGEDENKTQLAKEESKLEKEIVRRILGGKTESLKPNSGQAVAIDEHHICVGFHEEVGSDYRVWEWHGHIMLFDEEEGYTPEYIYGNYFERLLIRSAARKEERTEEVDDNDGQSRLGLKELIESSDSGNGRILHRNVHAGSPRSM